MYTACADSNLPRGWPGLDGAAPTGRAVTEAATTPRARSSPAPASTTPHGWDVQRKRETAACRHQLFRDPWHSPSLHAATASPTRAMDARGIQPGGCADSGAQDDAVVACSEAGELVMDVEKRLGERGSSCHGESCWAPARRIDPMAAERMLLTEIQHVKMLGRFVSKHSWPSISPVSTRCAAQRSV